MKKTASQKRILTDYHVHPDYSIDACPVKIRDYCQRAVELGLAEICFTTHLELDPHRQNLDNYVFFMGRRHPVRELTWLDSYVREIEEAQAEFRAYGLKVKIGLEVGYDVGLEEEIASILEEYPLDFVLGAIHCLDHKAISSMKESPLYYSNKTMARVRNDYFFVLEKAIETGFFNCIAHIDLYRRYGVNFFGDDILTIHRGALEPLLEKMAWKDVGLEINTSSVRRGTKEFHPTKEILSLAVQAGVKIFTVGSDAHRLEELGDRIDEALDLLEEFQVCNHVFTRGDPFPCVKATPKRGIE